MFHVYSDHDNYGGRFFGSFTVADGNSVVFGGKGQIRGVGNCLHNTAHGTANLTTCGKRRVVS